MELREVLQQRRSVRTYQDTPIEPHMVQALIDTAILAPSARNSQPWEFWVVLGKHRIDDLSDRAKAWLVEKVAHNPTAEAAQQRQFLATPELSLLYHAPALVLVAAPSFEKQADEDCCLAALTFMLSARDAGIGTCWIGLARPWFNQSATKAELGIPEATSIVAPLVLGYPRQWPKTQERNPATVHWIG